MRKRIVEVFETSIIEEVNKMLKQGWELYIVDSHRGKWMFLLVKRD